MHTFHLLLSQSAHSILDWASYDTKGSFFQVVMTGGWVMMPLIFLSVLTVAFIVVNLMTLRTNHVVTQKYMLMAEQWLSKGDLLGFMASSTQDRKIIARIMNRAINFMATHPQATFAQAADIAQTEGSREASRLHQQITWLSDIATIAPMLGLLGTVFGMIRSFNVMASDMAATRPMLLAAGVAQALVATAAGLVIGITAMAAYSFFRGRVQSMISDMEAATTHLLALLPKRS